MFLADYHTHSEFSFDGENGFAELLQAASNAGLNEVCFTDHYDMGQPKLFPAAERSRLFAQVRDSNRTGVKPLLGVELGEPVHKPARAGLAVSEVSYDFIIGSCHALRGEPDFYDIRDCSESEFHILLCEYFGELVEMIEWGRFDVLGHLEYPLRYNGFDIKFLPTFEDHLREVFAKLVEKGIGLELNMGKGLPDPAVYDLYRRCGGEIVTVGSDAHRAADVGAGVKEGLELLKEAGFSRVAAFEKRRCRFETI
jgi:histidinol-phosphatase (PHP family)